MARAVRRISLPALRAPKLPHLPKADDPDVFEEMTLQEHLEELRVRIVRSCFAVGAAFIIGFILSDNLLRVIKDKAQADGGLDIISPTEPIVLTFKIALYLAIGMAAPVLVWQLFGFLAPGLTGREKRFVLMSLPFVSILFVAGAAFSFFFAAPRAFDFLSHWNSDIFEWSPQGNEIVNFYLQLMIGMGLAFQLPIVMFVLSALNIVSPKRMTGFRKYAAMVIMVVAAIITPTPDPFNMFFVAVPIFVLWEVGLILARVASRRRATA